MRVETCIICGCLIGEGGKLPYILKKVEIDNYTDEKFIKYSLEFNYYCKEHMPRGKDCDGFTQITETIK